MGEVNLASARIVTARELTRDTARVLRDLNDLGDPVLVTRHGRFIAMLTPLQDVPLEVHALRQLASALPTQEALEDDELPTVGLGEIEALRHER